MEKRDGLSVMELESAVESRINGKEAGRIFIARVTVSCLAKNKLSKTLTLFRLSFNLHLTIKYTFHTIFLTLLQIF